MKKILLLNILLAAGILNANAQRIPPTYNQRIDTYSAPDDVEEPGFKKDHLFAGGNISLGFGTGQTSIGATPEIGYSFNKWLDAGLIFNINYNSISDYYTNGSTYQAFNYGVGGFARVYPVNFLFATLQPEQNWVNYTQTFNNQKSRFNTSATSLIAGIGYSQREIGRMGYYILLGVDLLRDPNSPYLDQNQVPLPIFRAGFNFYFKKR